MAVTKTCRGCGQQSPRVWGKCARCGASMNPLLSTAAAIVALILLLAGAIAWRIVARTDTTAKVPSHIVAVMEPAPSGAPVLRIPDAMTMEYQDEGSSVGIRIASHGMPILLVDVNHDGKIDGRGADLSFAAKPDGSICVQRIGLTERGVCGEVTTAATASVEGGPGGWKISFRIPKNELSTETDHAHVAFEIFNEHTQHGDYYPTAPFTRVYDLRFVPRTATQPVSIRTPSQAPEPVQPSTAGETPQGSSSGKLPGSPVTDSVETPESKPALPVIEFFQSGSETIERGTGVVLRWKTAHSTRVRIEPDTGLGTLPLQGERMVYPREDNRYTLTAEGSGGSVSSNLLVRVTAPSPPVIAAFRAESGTISSGGSTILRWNVSGTQSVKIAPGWNSLPSQGELQVSPEQTTQYVLSATNPGGTVSGEITVRVMPVPKPAISLDADPPSVVSGNTATLRWKVSDATRISIDPDLGARANEGSAVVRPGRTTQYTLTASGPGGTATRVLTVPVTPPLPSAGELVWKGTINGSQLLTIDKDRANFGSLQGSLPGVPCIIQPVNEKRVSVAAAPSPRNNYERLVLHINGNGPMTVVIKWSLQ